MNIENNTDNIERIIKLYIFFIDSGTYTCTATNKNGQAESSGKLIVVRGPAFTGGRISKPNPRMIANIGSKVEVRIYSSIEQSPNIKIFQIPD